MLSKMKTGYLLVYNGVQWSGFILIVLTLLKALRGGSGDWKFHTHDYYSLDRFHCCL